MVHFTFSTFVIPNAIFSSTVNGINDFGQTAGSYETGNSYGFVQTGGHYHSFRPPNSIVVPGSINGDIFPTGINNLDLLAGSYIDANTVPQIFTEHFDPFTGQFKHFQTVADPYPGTPLPGGLNDFGDIVGQNQFVANGLEGLVAWLDKGGTFTKFEDPQASTYTSPQAINDLGQITGWYDDTQGVPHGFLDTDGTFTTINVPGALQTQPAAINNLGEVVGMSYTPGGTDEFNGFIDVGGHISTIDVPGATGTFPTGVNDLGQVVGQYTGGSGGGHFVATPVPTPDHQIDLVKLKLTDFGLTRTPTFLRPPVR